MYRAATAVEQHGRGRASAPKTATFRRRRLPWRRRDDVSRRSRRRATWARATLRVEDGRIPTTVTSMARMWTYRAASTARRHGRGRGRRARPDDGGSHGGERRRMHPSRGINRTVTQKGNRMPPSAPLRGVSWTGDAFHRSHLGCKADGVVGTIARSVMDGERFPPITPWTQSRRVRGADDAAKFEERQRGHRRPPGGRRHRLG